MLKIYLTSYIAILLAYLILDGIWLGLVAKESYVTAMKGLLRESYPVAPWVLFYLFYAFAIMYLVVRPNLEAQLLSVVIAGAVLGAAAYGAYNLTNYAILKGWPLSITIKDLVWGIFITTVTSVAGWYAARAVMP